jgi:serine protease inhibitor
MFDLNKKLYNYLQKMNKDYLEVEDMEEIFGSIIELNDEYGWRSVEAIWVDDDYNLIASTMDEDGEEYEEDINLTFEETKLLEKWLDNQF